MRSARPSFVGLARPCPCWPDQAKAASSQVQQALHHCFPRKAARWFMILCRSGVSWPQDKQHHTIPSGGNSQYRANLTVCVLIFSLKGSGQPSLIFSGAMRRLTKPAVMGTGGDFLTDIASLVKSTASILSSPASSMSARSGIRSTGPCGTPAVMRRASQSSRFPVSPASCWRIAIQRHPSLPGRGSAKARRRSVRVPDDPDSYGLRTFKFNWQPQAKATQPGVKIICAGFIAVEKKRLFFLAADHHVRKNTALWCQQGTRADCRQRQVFRHWLSEGTAEMRCCLRRQHG